MALINRFLIALIFSLLIALGAVYWLPHAEILSRLASTQEKTLPSKQEEETALLAGDDLVKKRDLEGYLILRQEWEGQESIPEAWVLLDADALLSLGESAQAIALLESHCFPGKKDGARLLRLALMHLTLNPQKAWEYFTLAIEKDPENGELRTYRAKLLESAGYPERAESEFSRALKVEKHNPWIREQLVEFYLRQEDYPKALEAAALSLEPPLTEAAWVQGFFCAKALKPLALSVHELDFQEESVPELVAALSHLREGEFWLKGRESDGKVYSQQAAYWLKVMELLKQGQEFEATILLTTAPYEGSSWNPQLERALLRTLTYRARGTLHIDGLEAFPPKVLRKLPPHFQEIESLALESAQPSETLHTLLTGPAAFSSLFLSAGWLNAAVALKSDEPYVSFPLWYLQGLAQALYNTGRQKAAVSFLEPWSSVPELALMQAEYLLQGGDEGAAISLLEGLYSKDGITGYRAALLLGGIALDHSDYRAVSEIAAAQPSLRESAAGIELLARAAYFSRDYAEADRLYSAIEDESEEARSYLAKRAFEKKDWSRARALTEQLLKRHPDDIVLQSNLKRIQQAYL